jgi:NAD(P)-dependent dehydrogenase (short-subunit alcohol dehydrogenase family)
MIPRLGRAAASVALVTGSSRGIGAATARILVGAGARVIVNYREKKRREDAVVDEIHATGGSAEPTVSPGRHSAAGRRRACSVATLVPGYWTTTLPSCATPTLPCPA